MIYRTSLEGEILDETGAVVNEIVDAETINNVVEDVKDFEAVGGEGSVTIDDMSDELGIGDGNSETVGGGIDGTQELTEEDPEVEDVSVVELTESVESYTRNICTCEALILFNEKLSKSSNAVSQEDFNDMVLGVRKFFVKIDNMLTAALYRMGLAFFDGMHKFDRNITGLVGKILGDEPMKYAAEYGKNNDGRFKLLTIYQLDSIVTLTSVVALNTTKILRKFDERINSGNVDTNYTESVIAKLSHYLDQLKAFQSIQYCQWTIAPSIIASIIKTVNNDGAGGFRSWKRYYKDFNPSNVKNFEASAAAVGASDSSKVNPNLKAHVERIAKLATEISKASSAAYKIVTDEFGQYEKLIADYASYYAKRMKESN